MHDHPRRKPSELAGVLVTLAFLSICRGRSVWRVDWTVNGPAVLRRHSTWYIVILTGIAVVLRAGHIRPRRGSAPSRPWEVLGGSSEVDRLVDLMSWAAWIGVA